MNTYEPITHEEIVARVMQAHNRIAAAEQRVHLICDRNPAAGDLLVPSDMPMPTPPDEHTAYTSLIVCTDTEEFHSHQHNRVRWDWSEAYRRICSSYLRIDGRNTSPRPVFLRGAASPDEVVELIREADSLAERAEQEAAAYTEAVIIAVAQWRQAQSPAIVTLDQMVSDVRDEIRERDESQRLREAEKAEKERLASIEREREQAEQEKREAEEMAQRATWIEQHGSSRLQRLVAEDIEHKAVYLSERLTMERPGWSYDEDRRGKAKDTRNSRQEGLDMLDEARKTAPDAKLVWWVVDHEHGDDCDEYNCDKKTDWKGYACTAEFLGREIVFLVPSEYAC